jgi:hypothetical protein
VFEVNSMHSMSTKGEAAERIDTRLAALQDRYRQAIGRPAPEWLSPKARVRLAKADNRKPRTRKRNVRSC